MPKASEVAAELRKLAACLEKEPQTEIHQPSVYFQTYLGTDQHRKSLFLNVVRLMPRPFSKDTTENEIEIEYETPCIRVWSKIERNLVCRIVEDAKPAVYECEPLLSEAEEAQIGGAA